MFIPASLISQMQKLTGPAIRQDGEIRTRKWIIIRRKSKRL